MQTVTVEVEVRKTQGKGAAHKLRHGGKVPAVIYSKGGDNTPIQLDAKELKRVLSTTAGPNVLVNVKIKGAGDAMAQITEVQRDVFQTKILHVDFHRINMNELAHQTVRLVFHGHAEGEKEGAMVDHIRNEIEVEALPAALPEAIEVDVSKLAIGESIHVRDLKLPAGVKALTDGDEMVVVVHAARAQEEAPAAETADATLGAPAAAAE